MVVIAKSKLFELQVFKLKIANNKELKKSEINSALVIPLIQFFIVNYILYRGKKLSPGKAPRP